MCGQKRIANDHLLYVLSDLLVLIWSYFISKQAVVAAIQLQEGIQKKIRTL
jgi:hypothetical protein